MRCPVCHSTYEPGPPTLPVRILVILGSMQDKRPLLPSGIRDRLSRDGHGAVPPDGSIRQTLRTMVQRGEVVRRAISTGHRSIGYQLAPETYGQGVTPTLDPDRFTQQAPAEETTIRTDVEAGNYIYRLVHEDFTGKTVGIDQLQQALVDENQVMTRRQFSAGVQRLWSDGVVQVNDDMTILWETPNDDD